MNLPVPVAVGLWVVLGLVLLLAVLIGFARRRKDGGELVPSLYPVPGASELGTALAGPLHAIYVSTTPHGDWLRRIGVFGLGNRSDAIVTAYPAGVHIARRGEQDIFIPADTLTERTAATGIAGKYAPHEGLDIITWRPAGGGPPVDSGLRVVERGERAALGDAVDALIVPVAPESGAKPGALPGPAGTQPSSPTSTSTPNPMTSEESS
ncbi:hypothetical protein GCM10010401_22370 [Rarobacter faecitabidus]|uniref:PH domain-containing protein n=1 Tax=Rarobacter faecitabidus TaxID=13243 RepID=A0A542ZW58_RARFA|nr:hypothetical protein [Rarobacter faecitabidus]TQL64440.1 hypothetical protein FB461_0943 [Rarobacter faecitabidus]